MGGKVFPECKPFLGKEIHSTISVVESVLRANTVTVGSCFNYDPEREYGDLDLMLDLDLMQRITKSKTPLEVKKKLVKTLTDFEFTSKYIGNIVHIIVNDRQVDVMLIKDADQISKFHQYPQSEYKGRHVHILLSYIAKKYDLMWSPFVGLFARTNGKKGEFITNDVIEVCKHLKLKSFGNFEHISSQVDPTIVSQAKTDPNW